MPFSSLKSLNQIDIKPKQMAAFAAMHRLVVLLAEEDDVIKNTDEEPDEVDIQHESAIDGKIGAVFELSRFGKLVDIVHIKKRGDKHDTEDDEFNDPIDGFRSDEEVDQRDDENAENQGRENRPKHIEIRLLHQCRKNAIDQEDTARDEECDTDRIHAFTRTDKGKEERGEEDAHRESIDDIGRNDERHVLSESLDVENDECRNHQDDRNDDTDDIDGIHLLLASRTLEEDEQVRES